MSTENQYHIQAPGWFSQIRGNRDTATAVHMYGTRRWVYIHVLYVCALEFSPVISVFSHCMGRFRNGHLKGELVRDMVRELTGVEHIQPPQVAYLAAEG